MERQVSIDCVASLLHQAHNLGNPRIFSTLLDTNAVAQNVLTLHGIDQSRDPQFRGNQKDLSQITVEPPKKRR